MMFLNYLLLYLVIRDRLRNSAVLNVFFCINTGKLANSDVRRAEVNQIIIKLSKKNTFPTSDTKL